MKYSVGFILLLFCRSSYAGTFIGVLHKDAGVQELPGAIEPIFKYENKTWTAVEKIDCEKVHVSSWQILVDGKAREEIESKPMATDYQKEHCYFGVSSLPKLSKDEVVVGSIPNNAADPAH
jgi:hypothetical protein